MINKIISTFIIILIGGSLLVELGKGNGYPNTKEILINEPHKQTYEEFVQERLNVERMLK